jgi:hypothetical protein
VERWSFSGASVIPAFYLYEILIINVCVRNLYLIDLLKLVGGYLQCEWVAWYRHEVSRFYFSVFRIAVDDLDCSLNGVGVNLEG